MGNIVTNVLRIGEDDLLLQDAGARQTIQEIQTNLAQTESEALGGYATDTATGAIASFPDGADNVPVKSLTVDAESGHTQAVVTRTGVNVWDEEWENVSYGSSDGIKTHNASCVGSKNPVPVSPSTAYFFKIAANSADSNVVVYEYDASNTFLGRKFVTASSNNPLTTRANTKYINFYWGTSATTGTYNHDFAVNYPSTYHDYHAYNGHQYIIDLNSGSTETDITTIKGQNNFWADIGNVEVEYRADTKLYIQKVLNA